MSLLDQYKLEESPRQIPLQKKSTLDSYKVDQDDDSKDEDTSWHLGTRLKDEIAGVGQDLASSDFFKDGTLGAVKPLLDDVRKEYSKELNTDPSGQGSTVLSGGGRGISDSAASKGLQKAALGTTQAAGDLISAQADIPSIQGLIPGFKEKQKEIGTEISQTANNRLQKIDERAKGEGPFFEGAVTASEYAPDVISGVGGVKKMAWKEAKKLPGFLPKIKQVFKSTPDAMKSQAILSFNDPQGNTVEKDVPLDDRLLDRFKTSVRDAVVAGGFDATGSAAGVAFTELGNLWKAWNPSVEKIQESVVRGFRNQASNPQQITNALENSLDTASRTKLDILPTDDLATLKQKFRDITIPDGMDDQMAREYISSLQYKPTVGGALKTTDVGQDAINLEQSFKLENYEDPYKRAINNRQTAVGLLNQLNPRKDKEAIKRLADADFTTQKENLLNMLDASQGLVDQVKQNLDVAAILKEPGNKSVASQNALAQLNDLEKSLRNTKNDMYAKYLGDTEFDLADELQQIATMGSTGRYDSVAESPILKKTLGTVKKKGTIFNKKSFDKLVNTLSDEISKAGQGQREFLIEARKLIEDKRIQYLEDLPGAREELAKINTKYYSAFGKVQDEMLGNKVVSGAGDKFFNKLRGGELNSNSDTLQWFVSGKNNMERFDRIRAYKRALGTGDAEALANGENYLKSWLTDDLYGKLKHTKNPQAAFTNWNDQYKHVFEEFPEVGAYFKDVGSTIKSNDPAEMLAKVGTLKRDLMNFDRQIASTYRGKLYNGDTIDNQVSKIFGNGRNFDSAGFKTLQSELKSPEEKEALSQAIYDYIDEKVMQSMDGWVTPDGTFKGIDPRKLSDLTDPQGKSYRALVESLGQDSVKNLRTIAVIADDLKNLQKVTKAQPGESITKQLTNAPGIIRRIGLLAGSYKAGIGGEITLNLLSKMANSGKAQAAVNDLMLNPEKFLALWKQLDNATPQKESAIKVFLGDYGKLQPLSRGIISKQSEADYQSELPPQPIQEETVQPLPEQDVEQVTEPMSSTFAPESTTAVSSAKTPIEQTIKALGGRNGDYLIEAHRKEGSPGTTQKTGGQGSARGLFQFIDSTWRDLVNKYGKQDGVTYNDMAKPEAQIKMMNRLTDEHKAHLMRVLKRQPTNSELYTLHFLGQQAGTNLIVAAQKPEYENLMAASAFPKSYASNPHKFKDKEGNFFTIKQMANLL